MDDSLIFENKDMCSTEYFRTNVLHYGCNILFNFRVMRATTKIQ